MPGWHRSQDGVTPSQPPVQGRDHPQGSISSSVPQANPQLCLQTSFNHASPSRPLPAIPTTPTTSRTRSRENPFNVEPGSPPKNRSPLRQSVSYTDPPETSPASSVTYDLVDSLKILHPRSPTMTLTGDRRSTGGSQSSSGNRKPAWFSRASAPPVADRTQGIRPSLDSASLRRPRSQESTPQNTPPAAGPFSFLASSVSALTGRTSSHSAPSHNDELLHLDIQATLFPSGPPSDRDTFSPAAFKNLQMTAVGLLQRYQTAYQERTVAWKEAEAERDMENDSKDEADMRSHVLKLQLEEMARKVAEQESTMQALMDELRNEKKLRAEERHAQESGQLTPNGSSICEDLGVEQDQRMRWRNSGGSAKSEMSFETDEESTEEASVFSRSRSPTIATSVSEASTVDAPPSQSKAPIPEPFPPQKQPQQSMNALQKLFRGMSNDGSKPETVNSGPNVCRNCQGQDVSVAWDTASLLQHENKGLKQRVAELEVAVEGALDVVNGLTLCR